MARILLTDATETAIFSGKLNQLNDLWQQFCDLDEEVQQAALPTGVSTLHD